MILLISGCSSGPKGPQINGRVLGADGRPMIQSDIQLFSNEPTRPRILAHSFRVEDDGSYSIPVEHAGFYYMRVCGVNHQPVEIPLYIESVKNVDLDIRLNAVEYAKEAEWISVIGDFNNFSFRNGSIAMIRGDDGLFSTTIETPGDTLAYQILGIDQNGHSVNGTQADYFVPDEGGDYISVINTDDIDEVTIQFDMKALEYPAGGGAIVFGDRNDYEEHFAQIFKDVRDRRDVMWAAYREHTQKGGGPDDFGFDYDKDTAELAVKWESEDDPVLKEMRMWGRVAYGKFDSTLAAQVIERLGPEAPIWSVDPQLLRNTMMTTGNDSVYLDFMLTLVEKHPDDTIKPFILEHAMWVADNHDMDALVAAMYDDFVANYSSSSRLRSVNASYSPDRNIQPGKPVPDFRFTSIDDPAQRVDRERLLGKVYLIDFWATWCSPCVNEMEYLHEAHKEFGKKGLVIVSVSFDWQPERLTTFREEKWALPWFNAWEKWSEDSKLAKDFELVGIPKPVLVGKDGTIIATGMDIRGKKLQKTLAGIFN
jgi:thiol-disulfide isomerase/thioredoxin